jgi:hypothetical protein
LPLDGSPLIVVANAAWPDPVERDHDPEPHALQSIRPETSQQNHPRPRVMGEEVTPSGECRLSLAGNDFGDQAAPEAITPMPRPPAGRAATALCFPVATWSTNSDNATMFALTGQAAYN